MHYYVMDPEVAGGFGENTRMNGATNPPTVEYLHYEFTGWMGDALLESTPCYIVTEELAKAIVEANLTGCTVADVEVSTEYPFEEVHPGVELPAFRRLIPTGKPGRDDFALSPTVRLVDSDRAKTVLEQFGIANCDVADWTG